MPPRRRRRSAVTLFALVLAVTAASALWHPLYSAPDEPTHVIRSVAVARGQFRYREVTPAPGLPSSEVRVPRLFADSIYTPQCYIFQPQVPASCADLPEGRDEVRGLTYVGRYPPLYYLVVGLPSLVWESNAGVYAMRLVSAAICSLFLAGAMAIALRSRRRLLPVAVAIATTPTVIHLAGVVNPNGLEVAAALCLWVALVEVGLTRDLTWRGPLPWAALSGVVVATARPSGPLWLVAAGVAVLVSGLLSPVRPLLRRGTARIAAASVALAACSTVAWLASVGGTGFTGSPLEADGPVWWLSLEKTGRRLQHMVAYYGWLDTPAPAPVYVVWAVLACSAVGLAFLAATRRQAWAVALLVVGVLLVPVPFEVLQAREIGLFWQGRYTLPLAVGLPVLAAAVITGARVPRSWVERLRAASVVLVPAAQVVAVTWGMRRFAVGASGPLMYFTDPQWSPPLPHWSLAATVAAGMAAIAVTAARAARAPLLPERERVVERG